VCNGTTTTPPWSNRTIVYSPVPNTSQVLFGGAMPGSATTLSLFGDSLPDLAVSGSIANSVIYLVSGATVNGLASPSNLETVAEIKIALPLPWAGTAASGGLVRDINGDGYADFTVADANTTTTPGKVVVYW
jgi:hypothetical protein